MGVATAKLHIPLCLFGLVEENIDLLALCEVNIINNKTDIESAKYIALYVRRLYTNSMRY